MFGIVRYAIGSQDGALVGIILILSCPPKYLLFLCDYTSLLFDIVLPIIETTVEVLPRLCQIKYASGTLEELLYVDMPRESQNSSGQIVLDYTKAIQESVFEQLRVVREGHLRIVFNQDLKVIFFSIDTELFYIIVFPHTNCLAFYGKLNYSLVQATSIAY
jgi:hypothetical protein